ncbi:G2 and S phase-expressed protein 1 isoform X2 [Melanotaenia boesemani]|uniref:G2 and S phase-expressed protein 1 isoform X2 n=1 Tax=Melanotaenia boesemani TaxID=1250792 RepID=UPI001C03B9AF|nr:G2 and S phase-expressed protein 1 isoform X2 [Melanotaenia boesemani]
MDSQAKRDMFFLQDEKFDFDVSLSPASSKGDEDEDEVFVGPVSHEEKCVSANVASQLEERCGGVRVSWSPLTGDQLESVCQEAHRLASQLLNGESHSKDANTAHTLTDYPQEEFVHDTEAKQGMLGQTASALSPIKRQTFCVQDSPMRQLPPAIQRQLLRGSRPSTASSTRPTVTARLSTSSPVAGARVQPRTSLRGKSTLGVAAVLPSKPVAPTVSCSTSKSRVNKARLQPPSKTSGIVRKSLSSRPSSRAKSCEDLLSDSASVASDISDSSLNSSLLGKRPLAPPTKSVGVRSLSGIKAPPLQNRRVTDRKNTSSSSSSVSSFNSSISLSPAKGNMNSSLNRSLSTSTGPAPSSVSRPANPSRTRRSTVYASTETASSITARRSLSIQAKKLPETERLKSSKCTPLRRIEATPLQPTPTKRVVERTASVPTAAPVQQQSGLKAKPKPEALLLPTPSTAGKGVRQAKDVSKVLKPKRLMSAGSTDSLSQKPSAGPLTPSVGSCKSLEVKARRPSALPTPVKRRMSAVPAPTAQTIRSLAVMDSDTAPTPASARKAHSYSPVPKETKEEQPVDPPDIQPFSLEEKESLTTQPTQTEIMDHEALTESEAVPTTSLVKVEATEVTTSKTREVLLLDLPVPTPQPQEKLLIDLTNTPDLIRTSNKNCTTSQLIDLSSPLIKWSPDDKRENNAPLINLSF